MSQAVGLLLLLVAAPVLADDEGEPMEGLSRQTVVFWNARLAQRDHKPQDVLKLWMLRNAMHAAGSSSSSASSAETDGDFRSVVWAALGETGFCPDGFIEDEDGAGLWPLAIHNWLLKNLAKQTPSQPDTWPSLRAGMQQRHVSLNDVLSLEELKTVRFFRAQCLTQFRMIPRLPTIQWVDMKDRLSVGLMMRDLLELAETTLDKDKVQGRALLQTRRFDLDAALTRMTAARVRTSDSVLDQALRAAGISEGGTLMLQQQRLGEFRRSTSSALWRKAMKWTAADWLSLSEQRRLALFADADAGLKNDDARLRVVLMMVDALLEGSALPAGRTGPWAEGRELESWLGFASTTTTTRPLLIEQVTAGRRGERLLALEPSTGFRERSVIALHRGVQFLRAGDTLEALRSFAFALGHSDESSDAEAVHRLSQRWLAFVLSQYKSSDEVITIVERFVPSIDFNTIVESMVWRAAFHADVDSFERVGRAVRKNGTLQRTVTLLRPLAHGDAGAMWKAVEDGGTPNGTYLFAQRLIEQLSLEPLDVRANNRLTLEVAVTVLQSIDAKAGSSLQKKVRALEQRTQALRDAIGQYDQSIAGRVEAGAPDAEAYAGSVRLAPADPLPWPFVAPRVTPPSPFAPVVLTPVEWRRGSDDLVYGWSLHE
ncbi:MAG: hypothetical protein Q8O67_30415 [Deltaproteobacteria bacterium]|nr:hypothetical protein [Deltaproteobacteria bacterium]